MKLVAVFAVLLSLIGLAILVLVVVPDIGDCAPDMSIKPVTTSTSYVPLGTTVDITVEATNIGSTANEGDLILELKDDPNLGSSAITIVSYSFPTKPTLYLKGATVWGSYGTKQYTTLYPVICAYKGSWTNGQSYWMKVRVEPETVKSGWRFYVKATASDTSDVWSVNYAEPSSGIKDDYGEFVNVYNNILVSSPLMSIKSHAVITSKTITLGQTVDIKIDVTNKGGNAEEADVVLELPDDPNLGQADISIVTHTFSNNPQIILKGALVWGSYGTQRVNAQYPIICGFQGDWAYDKTYSMTVRIKPSTVKNGWKYYVKATASDYNQKWDVNYADPNSGTKDACNEFVSSSNVINVETPSMQITSVVVSTNSVPLGKTVDITIEARNNGGAAEEADLIIEFPDDPNLAAGDISVINHNFPKNPIVILKNNNVWSDYGTKQVAAMYPAVCGYKGEWSKGISYKMTIQIKPSKVKNGWTFFVKATASDYNSQWNAAYSDPNAGMVDAYNEFVKLFNNINVQTPSMAISQIKVSSASTPLGKTIDITVSVKNNGATASEGDVIIELVDDKKLNLNDIGIVSHDFSQIPRIYLQNANIWGNYGKNQFLALEPVICGFEGDWPAGATHTMTVRVRPSYSKSGWTYNVKATAADYTSTWKSSYSDPNNGVVDNYGEFVRVNNNINVNAPALKIKSVRTSANSITLGQSVDITIEVTNPGAEAEEGDIVLELPNDPDLDLDSIGIVSHTFDQDPRIFLKGTQVWKEYGKSQVAADSPLICGFQGDWPTGKTHSMTVRVKPSIISNGWIFFVKATGSDYFSKWDATYGDPSTGQIDTYNEFIKEYNSISVLRPLLQIQSVKPSVSSMTVGQWLELSVRVTNVGGTASEGDITIELIDDPLLTSDDIKVLNHDFSQEPRVILKDDTIWMDYGKKQTRSQHPIICGFQGDWRTGQTYSMTLRLRPSIITDAWTFQVKATAADYDSHWDPSYSDPSSGQTDVYNEYVKTYDDVKVISPSLEISRTYFSQSSLALGETTDVTVSVTNIGGTAMEGDITIELKDGPDLDLEDISIVNYDTAQSPKIILKGSVVWSDYGSSQISAVYPVICAYQTDWIAGRTHSLTIRLRPSIPKEDWTILAKATAADYFSRWNPSYGDPSTGEVDAYSEFVKVLQLCVMVPSLRIANLQHTPSSVTVGDSIDISIGVTNDGGVTKEGDVTLEFPDDPNLVASDIEIVSHDFDQEPRIYIKGSDVWYGYGTGKTPAKHPLVCGFQGDWQVGRTYSMTVRIRPSNAKSDWTYLVKATAQDYFDRYEVAYSDPRSGEKDDYSEYVRRAAVAVVEVSFDISVDIFPISGYSPLDVNFKATATGGVPPYSIAWDFGDGTTGDGYAIVHTYETTANAVFEPTCTVTDSKGRSDSMPCQPVSVNVLVIPSGSFMIKLMFRPMIIENTAILLSYWQVIGSSKVPVNGVSITFTPTPLPESATTSQRYNNLDGIVVASYDLTKMAGNEITVSPTGGRHQNKQIDLIFNAPAIEYTIVERQSSSSIELSAEIGLYAGIGFTISPYAKLSLVGTSTEVKEVSYETGGRAGITFKLVAFEGGLKGQVECSAGVELDVGLEFSGSFTLSEASSEFQTEVLTNLVTNSLLIGFSSAAMMTPAAPLVMPFLAHAIEECRDTVWEYVEASDDANFRVGAYIKGSLDLEPLDVDMSLINSGVTVDTRVRMPTVKLSGYFEVVPAIMFYKDGRTSLEMSFSFSGQGSLDLLCLRVNGGYARTISFSSTWSSPSSMLRFLVGIWTQETLPISFDICIGSAKGTNFDTSSAFNEVFNFNSILDDVSVGTEESVSFSIHFPLDNGQISSLTALRDHLLDYNILGVLEDIGAAIYKGLLFNEFTTYVIEKTREDSFDFGIGLTVGGFGFNMGTGIKQSKSRVVEAGYLYGLRKFPVAIYADIPQGPDCVEYCNEHFDCQRAIEIVLERFDFFSLNCPADASIYNKRDECIGWKQNGWVNEIQNASMYIRDDDIHSTETYALPKSDQYRISITGNLDGTYNYRMLSCIDGIIRLIELLNVELDLGTIDEYIINGDLSIQGYTPSKSKEIALCIATTTNDGLIKKVFVDLAFYEGQIYGIQQTDWSEILSDETLIISKDMDSDGDWDVYENPVAVVLPEFVLTSIKQLDNDNLRVSISFSTPSIENVEYYINVDGRGWYKVFTSKTGELTFGISDLQNGVHNIQIKIKVDRIESYPVTAFFTKNDIGHDDDKIFTTVFENAYVVVALIMISVVIILVIMFILRRRLG